MEEEIALQNRQSQSRDSEPSPPQPGSYSNLFDGTEEISNFGGRSPKKSPHVYQGKRGPLSPTSASRFLLNSPTAERTCRAPPIPPHKTSSGRMNRYAMEDGFGDNGFVREQEWERERRGGPRSVPDLRHSGEAGGSTRSTKQSAGRGPTYSYTPDLHSQRPTREIQQDFQRATSHTPDMRSSRGQHYPDERPEVSRATKPFSYLPDFSRAPANMADIRASLRTVQSRDRPTRLRTYQPVSTNEPETFAANSAHSGPHRTESYKGAVSNDKKVARIPYGPKFQESTSRGRRKSPSGERRPKQPLSFTKALEVSEDLSARHSNQERPRPILTGYRSPDREGQSDYDTNYEISV